MLGEVALPMKSEAGGSKEKVGAAGTEAEWVMIPCCHCRNVALFWRPEPVRTADRLKASHQRGSAVTGRRNWIMWISDWNQAALQVPFWPFQPQPPGPLLSHPSHPCVFQFSYFNFNAPPSDSNRWLRLPRDFSGPGTPRHWPHRAGTDAPSGVRRQADSSRPSGAPLRSHRPRCHE